LESPSSWQNLIQYCCSTRSVTTEKISEVDEESFLLPLQSVYIVAHLLKARTAEPEKQPLLSYACMQQRNCHSTRCNMYSCCYGTTA
jgi:hypothetical protein